MRIPHPFVFASLFLLAFLIGCGSGDAGTSSVVDQADEDPTQNTNEPGVSQAVEDAVYNARLVRTEYGIPHVMAEDWGSLGYGYGYAYAQDNFCVLMAEIVRSNGESAKYFGGNSNLSRDYVWRFYNTDEYIETEFIGAAAQELQDLLHGYAAGLNRYLADTGIDNLAEGDEGCRNAPWVREVTAVDLAKVYRKLIARAGTGPLAPAMIVAQAPEMTTAEVVTPEPQSFAFNTDALLPPVTEIGSNAYAVGSNASQTGKGILLGNPHFPWTGPERFYMVHLTIPGVYDVMGSSLQGVPIVNIGFNENVAWSHTVSTADRFALFEIHLTEDDPLKYNYDDEVRDIVPMPVSAEIMLGDGTVETRNETIYMTHFGPVVDLGSINPLAGGWPTVVGTILAVQDINLFNTRALRQWLDIGQSNNVADIQSALAVLGIPWVNTIAADREGTAYYADIGAMPNITEEKFGNCAIDGLAAIVTLAGFPALDGSRSECELGNDPGFPEGVFGVDQMPDLVTQDYAANSNDSYWLSNPDQLLEGFSRVIGRERVQQSIRTRQAFVQAGQRIAGQDGLGPGGFNIELMQEMVYGNRSLAAELVLDDLIQVCNSVDDWSQYSNNPDVAATACDVLNPWDCRTDADSVGVQLFIEFWNRARGLDNFWAVPFDPDNPVNTPTKLNTEDESVVEGVKAALGGAVDRLVGADIPLDRPWGETQFREADGERIPVHGGPGSIGFSVISPSFNSGLGYSPIRAGNSYIQTVTWDDTACPDAFAILTYSQSTDPASPHFADMTRLYGEEGWVDMPYCPDDIEAQKISETILTNVVE